MSYHFDQFIDRRNTFCTQWDYIKDRFGEEDLLPFSISDTDFKAPEPVIKAVSERVSHGIFGYSRWNHSAFKSSITGWYKNRFNADFNEDWVLYSPTVCYAISILIELNSKPKDKVVVFSPLYDAFFNIIKERDRELVLNPLHLENGRYTIDFKSLERELQTAEILLLTNPHNPTGRVFSKEELLKIIALCKTYDVFLISDDIHMDIVYPGSAYTPVLSLSTERVVICSSASKTMNTPGLIGSYLLVPDEALREQFLRILKGRDALSSVSILGMHALIAGYNEGASYVDELLLYLEKNMNLVRDFFSAELPDIAFLKPEATYLAWLDARGLNLTDDAIQNALVTKGKVAVMSGATYGAPGFLRLNVACPESKLLDGLSRMKKALH